MMIVDKAKSHYFRREYQQAIDQYMRALRLRPNLRSAYCGLATAYAKRSQLTQAVKTLALVRGPGDDTLVTASMGYLYGLMGRVSDARAILAHLEKGTNQNYVPSYSRRCCF
jgi:Flp pilus assembly protein TadD